jgi:hypothetical protein
MAIISGTLREQKLYRHLGFVPFGPIVGTEEAPFQPMYLTKEAFYDKEARFRRLMALPDEKCGKKEEPESKSAEEKISFLPGPVEMSEEVKREFSRAPVSHRAGEFVEDFQHVKQQLRALTSAENVEIVLGTGTLGNDIVAGQISLLEEHGLILSNGEFGERLLDHASRFRLSHHTVKKDWGETFDYEEIREVLNHNSKIRWLWGVPC